MRASASFFLLALALALSLAACGSVASSGTDAGPRGGGGRDAAGAGPDATPRKDAASRDAGVDATPACTPAFLQAGAGRQGDAEVPIYHRAAPSCCPSARERPTGQPYGMGSADGCSTDSQCADGSDGRCFPFEGLVGGSGCSYDQCVTDSDCPSGAPCICRTSASDVSANSCAAPGNCVVDSDCGPGGFCSPSGGACDYAPPSQSALAGDAFYCHTPSDTCVNDSDCTPPPGDAGVGCPMYQACAYDTVAGHWSCVSDRCCPP
jgi:hypothetical protein